ncbi:MAG: hypothetical protein U9N34_01525 [Candidatus Cloacimonadota bacterium]|nr:hypothetical protein [Candidatus Cloacimonadota bacterium]
MAYVNSGETKAAFYGSLGYSKSNAGKMHSRIVKQTNVKLSDDDEIIHLIDYHKKYLNPEIARYLAIVDTLIEEEEYKLSIYEEMKALKEEQ